MASLAGHCQHTPVAAPGLMLPSDKLNPHAQSSGDFRVVAPSGKISGLFEAWVQGFVPEILDGAWDIAMEYVVRPTFLAKSRMSGDAGKVHKAQRPSQS